MARRKTAYRMTPRRRAALARAQKISANKRRKNRVGSALKTAGTVAGYVGSTFAAYHLNRYITRPDQFVKESTAAGKALHKAGKAGFHRAQKATGMKRGGVKPKKQGMPNHIGYL